VRDHVVQRITYLKEIARTERKALELKVSPPEPMPR